MSDTDTLPDPAPANFSAPPAAPPPPAPTPATARTRRRSLWPLLGLIGFLLLAGGEAYLWRLYKTLPDQSAPIAALQAQLAAVQQQQQAPPPAPASIATPATPPAAPTPPPDQAIAADVTQRLATLDTEVAALQTQFAAAHGAIAALQGNVVDVGKLETDIAAAQTEANNDHTALTTLQTNIATLNKQTGKISNLGRLDTARLALDAGQPLGVMPNAPAALAKFADTPPPTEASLRLSYPAAARAAAAASVTNDGKRGTWAKALARLEGLVTISNGTHVIIGAPAAAVLAQAQARLDAGDLAGAVALLNTLSTSTQAAMSGWLSQARDLLAARSAIIAQAAQP